MIAICEDVADADSRALRGRLLDALRDRVSFDAHVWVLTDPATAVGVAPLARVPDALMVRLPDLIRTKYLTPVNRWTRLGDSVASLHAVPGSDDPAARAWRDLLGRNGVGDVASLAFSDRQGCWAFLDLWRIRGAPPFSVADLAVLAEVRAPITAALRRCQAAAFAIRPAPPEHPGPVVLLLSPALTVLGQTPATPAYLSALLPTPAAAAPIPAAAYNVAAQLLAVEAGVDSAPPWARVHVPGGSWLTLRADRIIQGPEQGAIAVSIERTGPAERVDLFARVHGLTDREREVIDRLCAGSDTRRVAAEMFLSAHTVQDHLKAIFAKTAVNSRRELLARALGG